MWRQREIVIISPEEKKSQVKKKMVEKKIKKSGKKIYSELCMLASPHS